MSCLSVFTKTAAVTALLVAIPFSYQQGKQDAPVPVPQPQATRTIYKHETTVIKPPVKYSPEACKEIPGAVTELNAAVSDFNSIRGDVKQMVNDSHPAIGSPVEINKFKSKTKQLDAEVLPMIERITEAQDKLTKLADQCNKES